MPEAEELEDKADEQDKEEEAENAPDEAKEASAKAPMPAMCARDQIGGHLRALHVTREQPYQKAL
jgi:hypothetical protein